MKDTLARILETLGGSDRVVVLVVGGEANIAPEPTHTAQVIPITQKVAHKGTTTTKASDPCAVHPMSQYRTAPEVIHAAMLTVWERNGKKGGVTFQDIRDELNSSPTRGGHARRVSDATIRQTLSTYNEVRWDRIAFGAYRPRPCK